jgi:Ca2+-binding EF-hand superfamily protein
MKWNEYDDYQKNTKEFSKSQKKSKKMAAAIKSGNVDSFMRADKNARELNRPRAQTRKKVKVRVKTRKRTVYPVQLGDEITSTNSSTSCAVGSISGPSSMLIDATCKAGRRATKAFVPGAHRLAAAAVCERRTALKQTAKVELNSAQLLRKAAMEKRMRMWDDHRKKHLNKAGRKVQRTWFAKKSKLFLEVVVWRKQIVFEADDQEYSPVNSTIQACGLTQGDLRRFKAAFDTYDTDGSGEIDYLEFCMMIESWAQTKNRLMSEYLNAIFEIYDIDQSGTLEFHEFIRLITCYSMYSRADIIEFCFKVFDNDGSGYYTEDEFTELLKALCGEDPTFPGNFNDALKQFDADGDGLISYLEFQELCKRYPMVFQPAFNLQERIQSAVLGQSRWRYYMRRRVRAGLARDFMESHGQEHPPLKMVEQARLILTGRNVYHELLPEVDWEVLEMERMFAMKGALKPNHMR